MARQPSSLPPLDVQRAPEGGEVGAVQSGWRLALREFSSNRLAVIGFAILIFFVLFSFVGPLIYKTNQLDTSLTLSNLPPSGAHLFGTDAQGFDALGRIMKGGQAALEIGFFAAFGATVLSLSLVIGFFSWQVPARLVRGEVLSLRERDFVLAARTAGASRWRLISRHLIPNALGVVIVNVTFQVADAILAVSYVGFLGFGLHFPNVDWGDQLSDGSTALQSGYWWLIYPVGACIVLTVMALNFIGDALRDATDVRLRRR